MPRFEYMLGVLLVCSAVAEQLPVTVFSIREGLPITTVQRIVVDTKGFVWMPGCEGLIRFDGNSFRAFTRADGLPDDCPLDIYERLDGRYWVAAGEHLCLFDPQPNVQHFRCEALKFGEIRLVIEDRRNVWCGTETGVWRRPLDASRPWESAGGRTGGVRGLLNDSRGDVWAATYSGLFRFRANGTVDKWTRAQGLADDFITMVSETAGAVWAGTQSELVRFRIDPQTAGASISDRYDRSHGLPSAHTFAVRFWRGVVWAATRQGLARQLPSGQWQAVEMDPAIHAFPVEALATDPLGNLWLGTDGGGAARISGSGFSSFSERDGLGVRKVWAVLENRDGDLMAVTKDEDRYFLNRFDGYRFHPIRPGIPGGKGWGWSWAQIAVHSRSGDWWLATDSGLFRHRGQLQSPPSLVGPESGLPNGAVFRVFEDSRGSLWVSSSVDGNHGIYRHNPGSGRFETFDETHGLPSLRRSENRAAAFVEDRQGSVWIGMLDSGLVRFRGGRFQQFVSSPNAPDQGVRALLVDRQGRLWIGSRRRGLMRVDNPTATQPLFISYSKTTGLANNTILALAEDGAGQIYAASGSGIDRIDPRAMPGVGRIRHFTAADGLPPGELRVGFRDRHGALWFGGDHGLVRFEPRQENTSAPPVLVHAIAVNGRRQPVSLIGETEPAPLSLAPEQRELQVDFGSFRHDLSYQTLLSHVDADWTPASAERSVHYLSLAPGSYQLAIRAVSPEGTVSPRPALVRFRIAPPVWQRWWFLLAAVSIVSGVVYTVHRSRVTRAVALERVRTRIAADLHDHIGSSLSHIAILSELAGQRVPGEQETVRRPLAEIENVSRELVDSMSDIVWAIDPRKDSLHDLSQRMRRWASDVLTGRNIELRFDAPESDLPLDAEMRREVFLVFKEAVHNMVRHSGCTEAKIELKRDGDELVLQVADNGCGFVPDEAVAGQGLASIRRRAARLGGTARFDSNGHGASVAFRVPLRGKTLRRHLFRW